jgi:hypothetical protein
VSTVTALVAQAGMWVASATPGPTPSPQPKIPDASQVSPGLGGFLIVFFLAIVVILLGRSMTKRIRRLKVRAEQMEAAEAEPGAPAAPGEKPQGPADGERQTGDSGPEKPGR